MPNSLNWVLISNNHAPKEPFLYLTKTFVVSDRRLSAMSKFEKRLCIVALVFVAIYLGAAIITIKYRISKPDRIERLESRELSTAEGQLLMAELFLPVMILLTLTVSYIVVRKTRAKKRLLLDEPDEEVPD